MSDPEPIDLSQLQNLNLAPDWVGDLQKRESAAGEVIWGRAPDHERESRGGGQGQGYGGGGEVFDWALIPKEIAARAVLSGGLHAANVAAGIRSLRALAAPDDSAPLGVDVSSGVEAAKGIKDAALIRAFMAAVRVADETI
jgi:hypothetical protein